MSEQPDRQGLHKGVASLSIGFVCLILNYAATNVWVFIPVLAGAIIGLVFGISSMRDASEGKTAGVIGIIISVILILLFVVGFGIGMGQARSY